MSWFAGLLRHIHWQLNAIVLEKHIASMFRVYFIVAYRQHQHRNIQMYITDTDYIVKIIQTTF